MKNNILFILFFILAISAEAQCWKDVKTITTNWNSYPTNSTNNWNWTDNINNDFYLTTNTYVSNGNVYSAVVQLPLPYFCNGSPGTGHCSNPNTTHFHQTPLADLDIHPEDGWELIIKNFGGENLQAGQLCLLADAINYPYFMLYNRHNGKIKTFFLVPEDQMLNGAEVSYEFDNYKTALYAHVLPITKPIQDFDNSATIRTPNFYDGRDYLWVYSEIQTYYDPCTCFDPRDTPDPNHPSQMKVRLNLDLTTQVDLVADGGITQQIVDPTSSGAGVSNPNSLISIYNTLNDGYNAGLEGYKSWSKYTARAKTYFDNINPDYKYKTVNEFWEEKNPFSDNSIVPNSVKDAYYNSFANTSDGYKELLGIKVTSSDLALVKNLASSIPYVGATIGVIDFFMIGGEESKVAPTPPPMNFNVNLKIKGTNYTPQTKHTLLFNTPGGSNNTGSYKPHYNNTLGVFGVLKSPRLGYYEYVQDDSGTSRDATVEPNEVTQSFLYDLAPRSKIRQYFLRDVLKYVVNPHAKTEVVSIDGAIVLEYNNSSIRKHIYFSSKCDDILFQTDPDCALLNKYPCYLPVVNEDLAVLKDLPLSEKIEKSGMELEYIEPDFVNFSTQKKMRIRTPYVPLECLHNLSFFLHIPNAQYDLNCKPKVMIKLYVKMKRTDIIDAELITEVLTVELPDAIENSEEIYTPSHTDFTWDWERVNSPNINFFYTNVTGINPVKKNTFYTDEKMKVFKSGDVITSDVYAWHTVKILNGAIISPGITISAGRSIFVAPEVTIPTDVNLKITGIGNFEGCSGNIEDYQATDAEITEVCTSSSYTSRSKQKRSNSVEQLVNTTSIKVYPNPFGNNIYVDLNLLKSTDLSYEIIDVTGRTVHETTNVWKEEGMNTISINTNNLLPGLYTLIIQTNYGVYSHKIVCNK